ncbi:MULTISPECIES: DMT family transporter [Vitreoscilla]|uniref:DMT family transporter n=1 Tax=Vitreoscilla stercoraria TaxID=61 RepID=A0ABY4E964_VITST|nr:MULTISPECIES: DMT family transporter [Vitreoscilla]QJQ52464.1 putative transporter [Vitreoscilla sp. C1]UOO92287.1 DMT family transporter [Vitreoscilla stercoraria]
MTKQLATAVGCLLLANMIWAGNALLARYASSGDLQPITMNFLRWSIGALVLLPFCVKTIYQHRGIWLKWDVFKKLLSLAILGMVIYNSLLYASAHHTTAINIALLNTCIPLATFMAAGILMGQWPKAASWLGLSIAASGLLYLISRGNIEALVQLQFNQGDLWMLVAVVAWSVYTVLLKIWAGKLGLPPLAMLNVMMCLAVILMLPLAGWEVAQLGLPSWNATNLGILAYIGIMASIVSYVAWNYGVGQVGPAKASLALYTMPVFSSILSYVLLGESLQHYHWVGGGIIVSGLLLASALGQVPKNK